MTDPTPETTPTRDEAVPTEWQTVPTTATRQMLDAFFKTMILRRPLSECWASALASAPAPASGRVDAVRRTGAEMIARHRFRLDADNNCAEIDSSGLAEEIDAALASLSPAATPVSEAGGASDRWYERWCAAEELIAQQAQDLARENAESQRRLECMDRRAEKIIAQDERIKALEAALAKPASSPAGVREELAANLLTAYHAIDAAWLASTGAQRLAKHDALAAIHEASRALSQSTSAGRVGE